MKLPVGAAALLSTLFLVNMGTGMCGLIDTTAAPVVAKTFAAYGGVEKLKTVTRISTKGTTKAFLKNDEGIILRYQEIPRKFRAEMRYQHSEETRIVNGNMGWRGFGPTTPEAVRGTSLQGMLFQNKHLELPMGFLNDTYDITLLGHDTIGTTATEVLSVTDHQAPDMLVHVDANTGLIVRISGIIRGGAVETIHTSDFFDYRKKDGIMVPHKIITYGGSDKVAEIIITEVKINPEFPPEIFSPNPPKGGNL